MGAWGAPPYLRTASVVWETPVYADMRRLQGRVPGFDSFHPKPAGAHTSSPLFVSLQEDKAMIMEQGVACLDF